MTHVAWYRCAFLKSIRRGYRKISNDAPKTGTKFVGAQKTEISVSADGDFGEMKKKRRLRSKAEELTGMQSELLAGNVFN